MAQYRDGTVTVTSNSATITGTDTRWISAGIEPGHWFTVRGQGITYTVAAVLSDTQIILSGAYQGATQSGVYYLLHTDFTPRGYAVPGPNDVDATIIVRRAIYDIDADLTAALGAPDGGSRAIRVSDILDLHSTTALTGQVMTKLSDGSYGFVSPASLSVSLINMTGSGTNLGQIYAGTNAGGAHQFRSLEIFGGSLSQNADRLTLTIPAVGEVNTLSSVGSQQSTSLVAPKAGSALNVYGLRGANGVSVARDGSDIVITGSGTGGSATSGEANTGENLGGTGANVVRPFADKSGVSLRFRSTLFHVDHFTVTGESTGQYIVSLRRQKLADSPDVDITSAAAGHIIRLESDGIWRSQALPSSGIARLRDDVAPSLGGDLSLAGKRVIGITDTISGMIEKPKAKNYTLILSSNAQFTISSMTALCQAGSVGFSVFLGDNLDDNPSDPGLAPIMGTASIGQPTQVILGNPLLVVSGSRLTMRLAPQSADAADFSFSIAVASA